MHDEVAYRPMHTSAPGADNLHETALHMLLECSDMLTFASRVETRCRCLGCPPYTAHICSSSVNSVNSCPATYNFEDNQGSFKTATDLFQSAIDSLLFCCIRSLCLSLLASSSTSIFCLQPLSELAATERSSSLSWLQRRRRSRGSVSPRWARQYRHYKVLLVPVSAGRSTSVPPRVSELRTSRASSLAFLSL